MAFSISRAVFIGSLIVIGLVFGRPLFLLSAQSTEWLQVVTDFLAILLLFMALVLVWGAVKATGGRVKKSTSWFFGSLLFLGFAIICGSVVQYYDWFPIELVLIIQALTLLLVTVCLLATSYWLYSVVAPINNEWRGAWLYGLAALLSLLVIIPSASDARSVSEAVVFVLWACGLVILTTVVVASWRAAVQIPIGYQRFWAMFSIALTTFLGTFLFWPSADKVWFVVIESSIPGQILLVLTSTFFLGTALHLRQLEIYIVAKETSNHQPN